MALGAPLGLLYTVTCSWLRPLAPFRWLDSLRSLSCREPASMHQRGNCKLPNLHVAVIALHDERPGLAFIRVDGDCCESIHVDLVKHGVPVELNGDGPAYEMDVVGLPFARRLARIYARSDAAVQRARAVCVWRLPVVFQYLNLVAPA